MGKKQGHHFFCNNKQKKLNPYETNRELFVYITEARLLFLMAMNEKENGGTSRLYGIEQPREFPNTTKQCDHSYNVETGSSNR